MYELKGVEYSLEQLQNTAKKYDMDFDSYLETMKTKYGLVEKTSDVATQGAPVTSASGMASNLVAFSLDSASSTVALSKLIDEDYEKVINIGKFTLQENTNESIKEKPQESQENKDVKKREKIRKQNSIVSAMTNSKIYRDYSNQLKDLPVMSLEAVEIRKKMDLIEENEYQKLYDENQDKLFYVTKMIDAHSYEYVRSTPIDVLYENMDAYINGLGDEKSTTTAASTFIAVANDSMENLTLRTLIKDSTYYQFMTNDNRGWIIESETKVKLGKSNEEILEFFKNPLNEEILDRMLSQVKNYWES